MKRNLSKINSQILKLNNYFKTNKNIVAVFLFGSFGTDYEQPNSDIDLAILYKNNPTLYDELEIECQLSRFFERDDIDVINLNTAPIDICHEVLYTGDLLYCSDEILLSDFKEKVFKIYGDYGITLKKIYEDLKEGMKIRYADNR